MELKQNGLMLFRNEVLEILNVSPGALDSLSSSRIILEVGGLYPGQQFNGNGIDGKFCSLISCFKKSKLTGEDIWHWMNLKNTNLEDLSPLGYLSVTEDIDRVRFLASVYCDLLMVSDSDQGRTDWKLTDENGSEHGIGDYTPKRRGGQH